MYNFLSIFSLGLIHKNNINGKYDSNNFCFINGKFYSFDLCISYFEEEILYIYRMTAELGNLYCNTTSRHINKILELCKKYDVNYELVELENTIYEKL